MSFYYYEGEYVVDIYVYLSDDGDNTGSGSNQGGTDSTDSGRLTNDGKGLPTDSDGVYDVDFTDGKFVQNVTDQGCYLDGCPTTGSAAVLVIPIEFSDVTAQSKGYTIANIEKIFNGGSSDLSYYSVYEYFLTSSYGKLDLDITVVDSWFRPRYTSTYYENKTTTANGYTEDIGDQLILDEALAYLATIMDLSKFDSDNNGVIDAVILVNTLTIGEDDFHWAYRKWNSYTDSDGYYYEYDKVSANDYIWVSYEFMYEFYDENGDVDFSPTNPLNPYTFIHEFSHILGADDYYDTVYKSEPMGGYDVMDSMAGDHNPYSKFNFGWITSSRLVVTGSSITLTLDPFAKNGDTIIIANNWDATLGAYQEYYVIMYYTATGLNAGEGGYFTRDGILVYHVNSSLFVGNYDGEIYYDVYNNNTSPSDDYGTEDNLIEFVLTRDGHYTYVAGDSLPTVTDDSGNTLGYTFTVNSLGANSATITFTKK
jgi:M6 family metalloprotease-like protein